MPPQEVQLCKAVEFLEEMGQALFAAVVTQRVAALAASGAARMSKPKKAALAVVDTTWLFALVPNTFIKSLPD